MNTKIVVGVVIVIVIVVGLGFGLSNSENDEDRVIIDDTDQVIEPLDDDKGIQFTIELSDAVTTTGP